jgi:glycosyltransferase involved in cell wall biosynthesis
VSGKPIIYETDDALQYLPAHHDAPNYRREVGGAIERFVKHADVVTVSTDFLAAMFRPIARRVVVLPNYLSSHLWTDDLGAADGAQRESVRIGFVGSMNHDRDFATLAPVLREALAKYPNVHVVSYGGISSGMENCQRFSVISADYNYAAHPRRLAQAEIDIAIAPLTPSRWNRCKSNVKFLEFGFLGIPGIFSDLEPYRDSVIHGRTGFLCDERQSSWRDALFTLIEDEELRRRVGRAAEDTVHTSWMLQPNVGQWLRAFETAIKAKGGRS